MYVLNLIDTYLGGTMLPIIAIFELYAVCWLYGIKRLALDIEFMLGAPPPLFLKLCWVVICPLSLTVGPLPVVLLSTTIKLTKDYLAPDTVLV